MFDKTTIGKKIALGLVLVAVLLMVVAVLGGLGLWAVLNATDQTEEAIANNALRADMLEAQVRELERMHRLEGALFSGIEPFDWFELAPALSPFGKWAAEPSVRDAKAADPAIGVLLEEARKTHQKLYDGLAELRRISGPPESKQVYSATIRPLVAEFRANLDEVNAILQAETLTGDEALRASSRTKAIVVVFSLIAGGLGVLLALLMLLAIVIIMVAIGISMMTISSAVLKRTKNEATETG